MLREWSVAEQRYRAVLEVLDGAVQGPHGLTHDDEGSPVVHHTQGLDLAPVRGGLVQRRTVPWYGLGASADPHLRLGGDVGRSGVPTGIVST